MANESTTVTPAEIEEMQRRAVAEPGYSDFAALLALSAEVDQTNLGTQATASTFVMWQGVNSNDLAS